MTITTVGYELNPKSLLGKSRSRCSSYETKLYDSGKMIAGCCALSGVFILTLPIPIVVNSFAVLYKNRLWRNEVEHKKKEMTKAMAAEKKETQKMMMMETLVKTVTSNLDSGQVGGVKRNVTSRGNHDRK